MTADTLVTDLPDGLPGSVRLALPGEVLDLLESPDEESARVHFRSTVADLFPGLDAEDRELMVRGLLGWREKALGRGQLMQGFVALPAGATDGDVTFESQVVWQVIAGVVEVPRTGDIDAGEIVSRYLGQQVDPETAYVESFPTRMGWGAGLLTTVPLLPSPARADDLAARGFPGRLGLALAVSARVDAAYGLLVIGLCLDGETTVDLGSLVAYVAGQSVMDDAPVREETSWRHSRDS
jgi:hypothetical protein